MRKGLAAIATAAVTALAALTLSGGAAADGWLCASGAADWWEPNYLPGYGNKAIGPHRTHWAQWSSDKPYYAWRKMTDGTVTYWQLINPPQGWSQHWSTDAYRYTGLKNANGVRASWFLAHFTRTGC